LVDHLNNGGLPDGFHAALAHSANQAGWDIQVLTKMVMSVSYKRPRSLHNMFRKPWSDIPILT
jgi:hypothetical protein